MNTQINEIIVMYLSAEKKSSDRQHHLMFLYTGDHVNLFFSISRCGEELCEKAIQLLVQGVITCPRASSWIPVE